MPEYSYNLFSPLRFLHPEPAPVKSRIFPLFLPFAGCPHRCSFCSQEAQTGQKFSDIHTTLAKAEQDCVSFAKRHAPPLELAFYGGTFTALPREDQQACLDFAARWRSLGLFTQARCSTRPDCVTPENLHFLRDNGITLVELGIQSFSNAALTASGRGYTADIAELGCHRVREAGLALGIQLMPGLPGSLPPEATEYHIEDIVKAISLHPTCLRLYPCLVQKNTRLALMWERKKYFPWPLDTTVSFLAEACLQAWNSQVPIIRMGLAPEAGLTENILAGPQHPALGSMARGLALARFIEQKLKENASPGTPQSPLLLFVPKRYQGEFWGHKGALIPFYAALGITPQQVTWWGQPEIYIHTPYLSTGASAVEL